MCQLLSLSFNREVSPVAPFSTLIHNSVFHPDGWGVAYFQGENTQGTLFKESCPAHASQLAYFLLGYKQFKSKLFIAHIRKATNGIVSYDNTHPFKRHFANNEYVFAHNGTLTKSKRLTRLYFKPTGNTDSERAFCYLLSQLRRWGIKPIRQDDDHWYVSAKLTPSFQPAKNVLIFAKTFQGCNHERERIQRVGCKGKVLAAAYRRVEGIWPQSAGVLPQ